MQCLVRGLVVCSYSKLGFPEITTAENASQQHRYRLLPSYGAPRAGSPPAAHALARAVPPELSLAT